MKASEVLDNVMAVVLSPPVYWFIVVLIIIKLMIVKYVPTSLLVYYQNIFVRTLFAIFIVIIAAYDYLLATILVLCYAVYLQELLNRRSTDVTPPSSNLMNYITSIFTGTELPSSVPSIQPPSLVIPIKPGNLVDAPDSANGVNYTVQRVNAVELVNQVNAGVEQSNDVPSSNMLVEIGNVGDHPADLTLTQSLAIKGFENLNSEQLAMASGKYCASSNKSIESSIDINNSQGLSDNVKIPLGYDSSENKNINSCLD